MAVGLTRGTYALALALGLAAGPAGAQDDTPPPSRAPRRLTLGIEGLVSVATDDSGYFNYSSYEKSTTELVRLRTEEWLQYASNDGQIGLTTVEPADLVNGIPYTVRALVYLKR